MDKINNEAFAALSTMSQHNEEVSKMLEESQLESRQHASKVVIYEEGSEDDEPIVCDDEEDN